VGDACQAASAVTGSGLFRAVSCDASPGAFITYSSFNGLSVAPAIATCPAGRRCAGGRRLQRHDRHGMPRARDSGRKPRRVPLRRQGIHIPSGRCQRPRCRVHRGPAPVDDGRTRPGRPLPPLLPARGHAVRRRPVSRTARQPHGGSGAEPACRRATRRPHGADAIPAGLPGPRRLPGRPGGRCQTRRT
jgi:hypothetical protein